MKAKNICMTVLLAFNLTGCSMAKQSPNNDIQTAQDMLSALQDAKSGHWTQSVQFPFWYAGYWLNNAGELSQYLDMEMGQAKTWRVAPQRLSPENLQTLAPTIAQQLPDPALSGAETVLLYDTKSYGTVGFLFLTLNSTGQWQANGWHSCRCEALYKSLMQK